LRVERKFWKKEVPGFGRRTLPANKIAKVNPPKNLSTSDENSHFGTRLKKNFTRVGLRGKIGFQWIVERRRCELDFITPFKVCM